MSYSQFILGKTDHVKGQKHQTWVGAFVKPLPSRDLQDYFIPLSPEHDANEQSAKRYKFNFIERGKVVNCFYGYIFSMLSEANITFFPVMASFSNSFFRSLACEMLKW